MHRFVDIERWTLNKGQGKKVISYSNSLKVIEHDENPWIWHWPWPQNEKTYGTIIAFVWMQKKKRENNK